MTLVDYDEAMIISCNFLWQYPAVLHFRCSDFHKL